VNLPNALTALRIFLVPWLVVLLLTRTHWGWFLGLVLLSLPFIILTVLIKLFLSERLPTSGHVPHQLQSK